MRKALYYSSSFESDEEDEQFFGRDAVNDEIDNIQLSASREPSLMGSALRLTEEDKENFY